MSSASFNDLNSLDIESNSIGITSNSLSFFSRLLMRPADRVGVEWLVNSKGSVERPPSKPHSHRNSTAKRFNSTSIGPAAFLHLPQPILLLRYRPQPSPARLHSVHPPSTPSTGTVGISGWSSMIFMFRLRTVNRGGPSWQAERLARPLERSAVSAAELAREWLWATIPVQ